METSYKTKAGYLGEGSAMILVFLFAYTAITKLYDWQGTKLAM